MKGATDNICELYRIICKHNKQHDYFMHADAALSGIILPFLDKDLSFKRHIHSIAISGHKFLGTSQVCSIFMMDKKFTELVNQDIEIIGSNDATLMGSRNGHAALLINYMVKLKKKDGFEMDIMECLGNADYLVDELNRMTKGCANAWRNHNSVTVICNRPKNNVVRKWQLATERNLSHVVVLPHVNRTKIDRFVGDYITVEFFYPVGHLILKVYKE